MSKAMKLRRKTSQNMKTFKATVSGFNIDQHVLLVGILPVGIVEVRRREILMLEDYTTEEIAIPEGLSDYKVINSTGKTLKLSLF